MSALLGALVAMIVGFGGPAGYLNLPVPPPVFGPVFEPYGGCDEAYLYPDTEGARACEGTP